MLYWEIHNIIDLCNIVQSYIFLKPYKYLQVVKVWMFYALYILEIVVLLYLKANLA